MTEDYEDVALDTLADIPVDMGEVEQGRRDAILAKGWYTTDPENAVVTVGKAEASGRPYARFFGVVTGPETGRYGFGWSWERKNRITEGVDTGKPDGMYQTYSNLLVLYKAVHGESPKKVSDLNEFVRVTPLLVNIVQGKNGGNFLGNGQPFKVAG